MIAKLTGTIVNTPNTTPLVVDVHGVGYAVHVPLRLALSTTPGQTISVHIHTYVREDALELFGFATADELSLFHLLLGVSGIGPRTALNVMNHDAAAIRQAIESGDVAFFTVVPRLGKKNAQKIIIELRSKLTGTTGSLPQEEQGETKELTDALISMGFDRREIQKTLSKIPDGSLKEKLRHALKHLGK